MTVQEFGFSNAGLSEMSSFAVERNSAQLVSSWILTKILNKDDCLRSKTRSKHKRKIKKNVFIMRNTTCEFSWYAPFSSYKTTLKQQLNGENGNKAAEPKADKCPASLSNPQNSHFVVVINSVLFNVLFLRSWILTPS